MMILQAFVRIPYSPATPNSICGHHVDRHISWHSLTVLQSLCGLSHSIPKQSYKGRCYFYQMRRLRLRKVEHLPSVRSLGSDRARPLGC